MTMGNETAKRGEAVGGMAGLGRLSGALKVGMVAGVSAVAGGLAVAWWHRKTLEKLRNPVEAGKADLEEDFPEIFGS